MHRGRLVWATGSEMQLQIRRCEKKTHWSQETPKLWGKVGIAHSAPAHAGWERGEYRFRQHGGDSVWLLQKAAQLALCVPGKLFGGRAR